MDDYKTMVVFRLFKESQPRIQGGYWQLGGEPIKKGNVIALFPCRNQKSILDTDAFYGSRYVGVNYKETMRDTRSARPEEAIDLADKLKDIGYNLAVRQRRPSHRYEEKWRAIGNT